MPYPDGTIRRSRRAEQREAPPSVAQVLSDMTHRHNAASSPVPIVSLLWKSTMMRARYAPSPELPERLAWFRRNMALRVLRIHRI
jgi:hypothetical protein